MKKIQWHAILIGFLAGLGTFMVGMLLLSLFLYLLGVQPARAFRSYHVGFPGPLTVLLIDALCLLTLTVSGYVTALISRPEGLLNAFVFGFGMTILLVILGGFHWYDLLIIPFCLTGALLTRQVAK